tara:strand:+ start:238 stop:456 length:219 start_codon:yes stop_codon:yes gene_type:complete
MEKFLDKIQVLSSDFLDVAKLLGNEARTEEDHGGISNEESSKDYIQYFERFIDSLTDKLGKVKEAHNNQFNK